MLSMMVILLIIVYIDRDFVLFCFVPLPHNNVYRLHHNLLVASWSSSLCSNDGPVRWKLRPPVAAVVVVAAADVAVVVAVCGDSVVLEVAVPAVLSVAAPPRLVAGGSAGEAEVAPEVLKAPPACRRSLMLASGVATGVECEAFRWW